jgi:hypothetical protein
MKLWWRKPVSEFAAGVARSLIEDPLSWDFDSFESSVVNQEASIEIDVTFRFGKVAAVGVNSGTSRIGQFRGIDLWAFRNAYRVWRALTAPDRRRIAERRKRLALEALGRRGVK